jgi:hypothetical protein
MKFHLLGYPHGLAASIHEKFGCCHMPNVILHALYVNPRDVRPSAGAGESTFGVGGVALAVVAVG